MPDPTPPGDLRAGERLRLGAASRPGSFTIGKGVTDFGTLRTLHGLDHELVLGDTRYLVHAETEAEERFALQTVERRELASYDAGTDLLVHRHTYGCTLPRTVKRLLRKPAEEPGTITRDGHSVATIAVRNRVVLVEAHTTLDLLTATFAAAVTLLRGGHDELPPRKPFTTFDPQAPISEGVISGH